MIENIVRYLTSLGLESNHQEMDKGGGKMADHPKMAQHSFQDHHGVLQFTQRVTTVKYPYVVPGLTYGIIPWANNPILHYYFNFPSIFFLGYAT